MVKFFPAKHCYSTENKQKLSDKMTASYCVIYSKQCSMYLKTKFEVYNIKKM